MPVSPDYETTIAAPSRMIGSFMDAMSEQMNSLSGEELDPKDKRGSGNGRTRRRASSIVVARPQVAVLGSSNPQTDVSTIQWLFPQKFKYETSQECVVLTEKTSSCTGGLVLMVVDCHTSGQSIPIHWKNATFVLDEREIIIAAERCRDKAATVFVRDTMDLGRGRSTTLAVIRLSGGGNLVLMSQAFLESQKGRKAFSNFVTSREKIETMDRNRDQNDGENFLQALEGEFDSRTHRRRSVEQTTVDVSTLRSSNSSFSDTSLMSYGAPSRSFPTLGLSLQRKHGFMQQDVPINARTPISFETDLFAGKVSILIKPQHQDDDPYHFEEVFSRTKVRFVLQIQGKFKYKPQGIVYAGLELAMDNTKAALIMQGLCSLILRHVRKKHPNCHHSLGEEGERPHIVVPAWTFFDRLIVTKPMSNASPPPIDEPLQESQGSVTARQSSQSTGAWNTVDTYSFASYSECIDFPSWHLVDASFARNTDLHNILGDSALKLVLYEHREPANSAASALHLQKYNHYLFALHIKHLGSVLEAEGALNKDEEAIDTTESLPWGKAKRANRYDDECYNVANNGSDNGGFASVNMLLADTKTADTAITSDDDDSVEYDNDDEEDDLIDDALVDPGLTVLPTKSLLETVNQTCPAWIQIVSDTCGYKKLYAFNNEKKVVFLTPAEFKSQLPIHKASLHVKGISSPRLSASEQARRILGYAYAQALEEDTDTAKELLANPKSLGANFLKRKPPPSQPQTAKVRKSGYMARALSERHWREEYVRLFDNHLAFFHPLKAKPSFRIYCRTVIATKRLKANEGPQLAGFHFYQVETLGRTVYLMFSALSERNSWADALEKVMKANKRDANEKGYTLDGIDDPTDQFLHKSSAWDCQQRRILNCRRFSFGVPNSVSLADPTVLIERALACAGEAQESPRDETKLIAFLDTVATLKDVDVYVLDESHRMAFFLNLFHLMIMHAYLLLGPPNSSFKYVSMFQMVSYQLSDDIFCFAELEHNIIRGAMSYPSQFSSKLILPKSTFGFALTTADFRINFALNHGALNQPDVICIYKAPILDIQFEAASLVALETVSVEQPTRRKTLVTLPELLKWYWKDFGETFYALLQTIDDYMDEASRNILEDVLDESEDNVSKLTVKYLPAEFICRRVKFESTKARGYNVSFKQKDPLDGDDDDEQ